MTTTNTAMSTCENNDFTHTSSKLDDTPPSTSTSSHPSSRLSTPNSETDNMQLPPQIGSTISGEESGENDGAMQKIKSIGSKTGMEMENEETQTSVSSGPTPPPRMTRLPSLQQISTHLHLTPSSTPMTTPNSQDENRSQQSVNPQTTPPSLKILTNTTSSGISNNLIQSPYVPSPSSRLKLPASAMLRTMSGGVSISGVNIKEQPTIPPPPSFPSFSSSSVPSPSGKASFLPSKPITTGDINDPFTSPSKSMLPTPSGPTSVSPLPGRPGPSESFIKGYKDIPSLAEIGRRMSVTRNKSISVGSSPATALGGPDSKPPAVAEVEGDVSVEQRVGEKDKESKETIDKTEEASTPSSAGFEDVKRKKEHPLQHAWTLYFDSKSYKPDPQHSVAPGEPVLDEYEKSLLTVGKFDSVEGFARYMNNVRLPSQLARNSNYHMFKNGIRPMWEDPANAKGGKWVILIRSSPSLLDIAWANLTMALVGEVLDPEDQVCGVVASNRPKVDRIQVWTRGRDDVDVVNRIGRGILEAMGFDLREMEAVSMEFQYNASNAAPPIGKFLHVPFGPARSTLSFSGIPSSTIPLTPSKLGVIPSSPQIPGNNITPNRISTPTPNPIPTSISIAGGSLPHSQLLGQNQGIRRSSASGLGGSGQTFASPIGARLGGLGDPSVSLGPGPGPGPGSGSGPYPGGGPGGVGVLSDRRRSDSGTPPGVSVGKGSSGAW